SVSERAEGDSVRPGGAHDLSRNLCVDAQKRLIQLLRIVEDGRSNLGRRPLDRAAVRVHLIGGVAAEGLEPVTRGIEEVARPAPRDPMTAGTIAAPRRVHRT